jgi:hypothetical protein
LEVIYEFSSSYRSPSSHLEHRAFVKCFISLQFLNLKQLVGLLGWDNKHRHPFLEWDSNPWSQSSSGHRHFMPWSAWSLWSAYLWLDVCKHSIKPPCLSHPCSHSRIWEQLTPFKGWDIYVIWCSLNF